MSQVFETHTGFEGSEAPLVMDGRFYEAGIEPRIADMLQDPIVGLVMRRDKVSASEVFSLMQQAVSRLS